MQLKQSPVTNKASYFILVLILLVKLASPFLLIHPIYELHRDEFLHLDQANHPAWGYLSVPPFTSWISMLIQLLGNGIFWVKFFPALMGACTIWVAWKITESLNGGWFARTLAATALLFSVLLRINMLYQPNSFDILGWTMIFGCMVQYVKTRQVKWIYAAGVCFAISFLNKYNVGFLAASMAGGLILTTQREIYSRRSIYFAGAAALVMILPNIIWQYNNGFPIVHHMKELAETQLVNVARADFVREQLLFFVNSCFLLIAAFAGMLWYPPFKKYRFVGWTFVICIALFLYFKAKGYYAIGLYPVMLSFGAVYLEFVLKGRLVLVWRGLTFVILLILFIPFLLAFPIVTPQTIIAHEQLYKKIGLLKWEDGKDHSLPQDFADMQGWKELASKTDSIYRRLPADEYTIIRTDNYGQAGAVNYYATQKSVSYNADYLNWFDLGKPVVNMIMIKENEDDDPLREREKPYFESVSLVDSIMNPYAREKGTKIYLLRHALININPILQKEIEAIRTGMRVH